jgi:hypothetical protein
MTLEYLKKIYEIADAYSTNKKVIFRCAKKRYWVLSTLVTAEFIFLLLWLFNHTYWLMGGAFIFLIAAISISISMVRTGNKYVAQQYAQYLEPNHKFGWITYRYGFVLKGMEDELEELIVQNALNHPDKINELIAIVESDVAEIRSLRWFPFAVLGVMLVPVWGEFCGFMYNQISSDAKDPYSVAFILAGTQIANAFLFTIITTISVYIFADLILNQPRRKILVRTLRFLKIKFIS